MKMNDCDIDDFLMEEAVRDSHRRAALCILLDEQRERARHFLALRMKMGITDSYMASMPLSWVESQVWFADDLPLFEERSDIKKISINQNAASIQQQIDWRRQASMSTYLAERENYKFPPLVVVAYQNWAYQTPIESDNWGPDGRAIKSSIYAMPLDTNGYFLDVVDEHTRYYVLDGQHRLLAIRGLKELLDYGHLSGRDKEGKRKNKGTVHLDTIIDSIIERRKKLGDNRTNKTDVRDWLRKRLSDTIGVEIIPAVQKWETKEEATARLRQIFADLH